MRNNTFICPRCGRKSTDYKHSINKTLVSCLWALHNAGGCARLDKLTLDNVQFTNFQKLKYFNLIVSTGQNNQWQITRLGVDFLHGRKSIARFVITRNALVVRWADEMVFVQDVKDCVQYKIEWQEQAGQLNLFDFRSGQK